MLLSANSGKNEPLSHIDNPNIFMYNKTKQKLFKNFYNFFQKSCSIKPLFPVYKVEQIKIPRRSPRQKGAPLMTDPQIIDLYWSRSEQAIAETDKKYGRYCHYIAYNILSDHSDAEEIVNDTYLKTWNTIPPKRPDPLKGYVGKISNNLALNRYEEKHTAKRGGGQMPLIYEELSECVSGTESDPGEIFTLQETLNKFLASLPEKTRNIFVRRYWYAAPVSEIAKEFHMTESHITVLMLRTRKKLKEYLIKEGFEL